MKKKYMVGFFLALFCMVLLVSAGYAASYRYVMQRQEARVEEAEKREEDFLQQSVMTDKEDLRVLFKRIKRLRCGLSCGWDKPL